MESNLEKYIKPYFDSLNELKPVPTHVEPQLRKLDNIKAVIFDIYGTLIISASGDIEEAEMSEDHLLEAFSVSRIQITAPDLQTSASLILNQYCQEIKIFHSFVEHTKYPEVEIREIWEKVLGYMSTRGVIEEHYTDDQIIVLAFVFELLSNRIYPMPNMNEILKWLEEKVSLGIVSNAQFYSPISLNYFITEKLVKTSNISGFDPELCLFSYKLLRAKPDPALYIKLAGILDKERGIKPDEVLYVGNDMLKDIYAAKQANFKTALFAGDARSLRLRKELDYIKGCNPEVVITDLSQIKEII